MSQTRRFRVPADTSLILSDAHRMLRPYLIANYINEGFSQEVAEWAADDAHRLYAFICNAEATSEEKDDLLARNEYISHQMNNLAREIIRIQKDYANKATKSNTECETTDRPQSN